MWLKNGYRQLTIDGDQHRMRMHRGIVLRRLDCERRLRERRRMLRSLVIEAMESRLPLASELFPNSFSNLESISPPADVTPPTVLSTTPSISSGTIAYGTTHLNVNFSEIVSGGYAAGNFELRDPGTDKILGNADDIIAVLTPSFSNPSPTQIFSAIEFPALSEGTYRFTVKNSIRDLGGLPLDGNEDGIDGDACTRDFVVVRGDREAIQVSPQPFDNSSTGNATAIFKEVIVGR